AFSDLLCHFFSFFLVFFTAAASTSFYTLSLHDALPILIYDCHEVYPACFHQCLCRRAIDCLCEFLFSTQLAAFRRHVHHLIRYRSEEHTSELQSRENLVCRLLLEKKKKNRKTNTHYTQQ